MNCNNNQNNNNGCGCNCNPHPTPATKPVDINMNVCDRNINMLPMLQTYTTKVLKPNINGCCKKNILTQEMMNCEDMKYVIKWDFDLNGKTITVPENCILEFDGGSLKNGTIIGQDTVFINVGDVDIWGENLVRQGTWVEHSGGGSTIDVDDHLDSESENPLQNKVITNALNREISRATEAEQRKINADRVYTKQEADSKFLTSHQDISGKANKATTLSGYGITNAYTKDEVNTKNEELADNLEEDLQQTVSNLNATIANQNAKIAALEGEEPPIIGPLPASGEEGKKYRVPGVDSYTDYAWNGSQFVLLATYNNAIDNTIDPTSNNPISGAGVSGAIGMIIKGSLEGNGADFAANTILTTLPLNSNILVRLPNKVTFSGNRSLDQRFLALTFIGVDSGSEVSAAYVLTGKYFTEIPDYIICHTPNVECFLHIEGRWLATEVLNYEVYTGDSIVDKQNALGNSQTCSMTGTGSNWLQPACQIPDNSKPSKIIFDSSAHNAVEGDAFLVYINDNVEPYYKGAYGADLEEGTVIDLPICNSVRFETRIQTGEPFSFRLIQSDRVTDVKYLLNNTKKSVIPNNDDAVTSGAVAEEIGILAKGSIRGNDSNWAVLSHIINFAPNTPIAIRFPNMDEISFMGSDAQTSLRAFVNDGTTDYTIVDIKYNNRNAVYNKIFFIDTPNASTYLQIEGRWNRFEYLEYEVITGEKLAALKTGDTFNNTIECVGNGLNWIQKTIIPSNPTIPSRIIFKNSATNPKSDGVNYLVYVDDVQSIEGQFGRNLIEGTVLDVPAGAKIRFETRVASGETFVFEQTQGNIADDAYYSAVTEATNVIHRNGFRDAAIRSCGVGGNFGFIHISDLHTRAYPGYKCLVNARKLMEQYTNLRCCIITGDIVYDTFADSMTYYNKALAGSDRMFLNVIGNHDAGQPHEIGGNWTNSQGTDQQVYEKYIAPYKDSWNLGNGDTGKNYYFKDFVDDKIRLIVLYDYETEQLYNGEEERTYWRENCAVRQAQVDWLINTLLNTPYDYGVIVAHHECYSMEDSTDNPFATEGLNHAEMNTDYHYCSDPHWLDKILSAYKKREQLNISWEQTGGVITSLQAVADFRGVQSEFICILAGHTHEDFIGHPIGYPELTQVIIGADNLHYTGSSCRRAYDSVSEDLVNVVNVNRIKKTITVIRVGSDFSTSGQKRDIITINY